jgi:K+ transporter
MRCRRTIWCGGLRPFSILSWVHRELAPHYPKIGRPSIDPVLMIRMLIIGLELRFGFMEQPDVPKGLELAVTRGQCSQCDPRKVTYYTGDETIIASGSRPGMARWREQLFAFMHHNAQRPGAYFKIPGARVEFEM